jgi:hypothetical protein
MMVRPFGLARTRADWRLVAGGVALALVVGVRGLEAQTTGALHVRARVERAEAGAQVLTVARALADSLPTDRTLRRDLRLATVTVTTAPAVADSLDKPRTSRPRRIASIQFLKN